MVVVAQLLFRFDFKDFYLLGYEITIEDSGKFPSIIFMGSRDFTNFNSQYKSPISTRIVE